MSQKVTSANRIQCQNAGTGILDTVKDARAEISEDFIDALARQGEYQRRADVSCLK